MYERRLMMNCLVSSDSSRRKSPEIPVLVLVLSWPRDADWEGSKEVTETLVINTQSDPEHFFSLTL